MRQDTGADEQKPADCDDNGTGGRVRALIDFEHQSGRAEEHPEPGHHIHPQRFTGPHVNVNVHPVIG